MSSSSTLLVGSALVSLVGSYGAKDKNPAIAAVSLVAMSVGLETGLHLVNDPETKRDELKKLVKVAAYSAIVGSVVGAAMSIILKPRMSKNAAVVACALGTSVSTLAVKKLMNGKALRVNDTFNTMAVTSLSTIASLAVADWLGKATDRLTTLFYGAFQGVAGSVSGQITSNFLEEKFLMEGVPSSAFVGAAVGTASSIRDALKFTPESSGGDKSSSVENEFPDQHAAADTLKVDTRVAAENAAADLKAANDKIAAKEENYAQKKAHFTREVEALKKKGFKLNTAREIERLMNGEDLKVKHDFGIAKYKKTIPGEKVENPAAERKAFNDASAARSNQNSPVSQQPASVGTSSTSTTTSTSSRVTETESGASSAFLRFTESSMPTHRTLVLRSRLPIEVALSPRGPVIAVEARPLVARARHVNIFEPPVPQLQEVSSSSCSSSSTTEKLESLLLKPQSELLRKIRKAERAICLMSAQRDSCPKGKAGRVKRSHLSDQITYHSERLESLKEELN